MNHKHSTISYRLTQNIPQTQTFEIPLCLGAFVAAIWAKELRKINLFMQNKPNLPENQVNARSVLTKGYEADIVFWPKNPKPNLPENQVNASSVLTKGYEADIVFWPKNPKPKTNPISNPAKPEILRRCSVLGTPYGGQVFD